MTLKIALNVKVVLSAFRSHYIKERNTFTPFMHILQLFQKSKGDSIFILCILN
jgi:hypothetical protein